MQLSPEVLYGIAAVLVLVGLVGTFLPALPGVPLVFAGMVLAAYAGEFSRVGRSTLIVLGLLTIFALLVDFLAVSLGAKRAGASRAAVVGAAVGTLIGLFMGPFGVLFGSFAGAVGGELLATGKAQHATRVGFAAWLGLLLGTLFKLALTFAMIGIFTAAWLIE
ncbi:MAG TPA: DUF456 domain-containing protein [Steroidobacteraceae bacterium]